MLETLDSLIAEVDAKFQSLGTLETTKDRQSFDEFKRTLANLQQARTWLAFHVDRTKNK